jgi:hypothetical protein
MPNCSKQAAGAKPDRTRERARRAKRRIMTSILKFTFSLSQQLKLDIVAADTQHLPGVLEFFVANGASVALLSRHGVTAVPRQTPNHAVCVTSIAFCDCDEAAAAFERQVDLDVPFVPRRISKPGDAP